MTDYQILRLYRRPDDEEGDDVRPDSNGVVPLPETLTRGGDDERAAFFGLARAFGLPVEKAQAEWEAKRGKKEEAGHGR